MWNIVKFEVQILLHYFYMLGRICENIYKFKVLKANRVYFMQYSILRGILGH